MLAGKQRLRFDGFVVHAFHLAKREADQLLIDDLRSENAVQIEGRDPDSYRRRRCVCARGLSVPVAHVQRAAHNDDGDEQRGYNRANSG